MNSAIIKNELGLHARPITKWLEAIKILDADITVICKGKKYNGNSMIGLMSMAAKKGDELSIESEGTDSEKAIKMLLDLIEDGFGE
ncbi:HPr family phosphocarrier protein [Vallitalea maricola]|uniref:HPr family phosphocarrier protein n=1 Tax=Vallitalea maricola TaxID=3074433 RepID=A0ACB5UF75_9FIRM|nr:HPr family phosphocarrier protein [Vallitalea sp. AN17-2]